MEHPFVFEVDDVQAGPMKTYIDAHPGQGPVLCAFTVPLLSGQVFLFMNVWDAACTGYTPAADGRTRFTFTVTGQPDRLLTINMLRPDMQAGDFGSVGSYNPATDRKVEIGGIAGAFYPEVVVDEEDRTLTLTYSSREGGGIYGWVNAIVAQGAIDKRAVSVIQLDADQNEIGRDNYTGCFPLRYEILDGFGLDTTLRGRVVLSYDVHAQP